VRSSKGELSLETSGNLLLPKALPSSVQQKVRAAISHLPEDKHLQRTIPPFVVQLSGEYVIEILNVIWENRTSLYKSIYGDFLGANPNFFSQTEQQFGAIGIAITGRFPRASILDFDFWSSLSLFLK
jgi:hypothetical protein